MFSLYLPSVKFKRSEQTADVVLVTGMRLPTLPHTVKQFFFILRKQVAFRSDPLHPGLNHKLTAPCKLNTKTLVSKCE